MLSDPDKRDVYDKYGLDGLKEGGGGGGGGQDIFESFFGGGQRSNQPRKAKAKLIEVTVSLEDAYNGKMIEKTYKRKRICEPCEGKGGKNAKVHNYKNHSLSSVQGCFLYVLVLFSVS